MDVKYQPPYFITIDDKLGETFFYPLLDDLDCYYLRSINEFNLSSELNSELDIELNNTLIDEIN
jgi:hypothetical protein